MNSKFVYLWSFLLTIVLLAVSLYLQFFEQIMPCPLCSLQRLVFCFLSVIFLLGFLLCRHKTARFIINCLATLFSILGIMLASRQIWLQLHPLSGSSECGVSLQYMVQVLPMNEVMQKVFAGSAECTQRGWEFLSLTMAEWSLIWFVIFLLIGLYLFRKDRGRFYD